jgi:hypothetical protein
MWPIESVCVASIPPGSGGVQGYQLERATSLPHRLRHLSVRLCRHSARNWLHDDPWPHVYDTSRSHRVRASNTDCVQRPAPVLC